MPDITLDNIILIGMPGSGKSTLGSALAKTRGMQWIDTDDLIMDSTGKTLEEILYDGGVDVLWKVESSILEHLTCHNTVVSTGGSAVYHDRAMEHLGHMGVVVMIDVSLDVLQRRLGDLQARGVALRHGFAHSVSDVYTERMPLYRKYAHLIFSPDKAKAKASAENLSHIIDNEYVTQ